MLQLELALLIFWPQLFSQYLRAWHTSASL